jgi:hypothetical protein
MICLTYSFAARDGAEFVVPMGVPTPHAAPVGFEMSGARMRAVGAPGQAQMLAVGTPEDARITISVRFQASGPDYPDAMFRPVDSRFTRSAAALAGEARSIAEAAGGGRAGLHAIVQHVAGLFDYGHPEQRFYDGYTEIPQLCDMTAGSCVDINAYLIAALRSAGYEAGYIYGAFVPETKRSWCEDGHCWVITRLDGVCEAWDIAHFLKMGRRTVTPALNPRPGVRLPMAHGMGWTVPELGLQDVKVMGTPYWLSEGDLSVPDDLEIRLDGYDVLAASTLQAAE